jgi:regulator of sirC expression with transglutaminase-like and TPR domain
MPRFALLVAGLAWFCLPAGAADENKPAFADKAVEKIAASARKSIAVITVTGRDGKREGLGTGFVVSADGLIATNLHVIGEARPISVHLPDRKPCEATHIHATDRAADLAILRIDAKDLTPLPLGDATKLPQGAAVVALGNPLGLERSIVAGVVSGQREIEGRQMIQLAMPIERGNSGGPLVDLEGKVQGVVTMKHAFTENLGFAVPINALRPLLEKPNPVAMNRWLTIGALDSEDWAVINGARWRQRAGRILVEGYGYGFGGRSLCLSRRPVPELPFEIQVTVRLDNEAGAAGLAFHADGGDKHYGFYPSAGQLRLTRFEGPDVFSWKILHQEPSRHYRPGDWNTLKVRLDKDKILCYVNGHLVVESTDTGLTAGQVGLAKFRDTRPEFKNFQVAQQIAAPRLPADLTARITRAVEALPAQGAPKADLVDALQPEAAASMAVLRERAKRLEEQAAQLRELADAVHVKRVQAELTQVLQGKEDDIDLIHAALLLAKLDNDELDLAPYRKEVERMAREVAAGLPEGADDKARLAALNKYLFEERGFHGSRSDYYNRANSYLNEVLDDREGLPITLSVLYLELARRLGVKVVGVGLPGHFVVQHVLAEGEAQLIDVYEGGRLLSRAEAGRKVQAITGQPLREEHLAPAGKQAILVRMLSNLLRVARGEKDAKGMLRYLDVLLALQRDAAEERLLRAAVRFELGQRQAALEDLDWLLEHDPPGIDLERVRGLRRLLERPER